MSIILIQMPSTNKENDMHIYSAWRKHEAYQVPVTEEGEYKAMQRFESFKAGWLQAEQRMKGKNKENDMDKLLTIPKEKHIHRMKNGSLYKMPLSQEEISRLIKYHDSDLIGLIRAVEKVHGVV